VLTLSQLIALLRKRGSSERVIVVHGILVEPSCGYCGEAFNDDDKIVVSVLSGIGFHLDCHMKLLTEPEN
jgi:NAD-dependent SIR2 family protein deacetylase